MSKPAAEKVDHFRAMLPGAMRKKSLPRGARVNAMFEAVECGQQVSSPHTIIQAIATALSAASLLLRLQLAHWLVDQ
jgi:hypothetical protein